MACRYCRESIETAVCIGWYLASDMSCGWALWIFSPIDSVGVGVFFGLYIYIRVKLILLIYYTVIIKYRD